MKEANCFVSALFVALLAANTLPGCATGPILVDGRLQFLEYQFSVDSPPTGWRIVEPKSQNHLVAWQNSATKSQIGITAIKVPAGISLQTVAETFKAAMPRAIPEMLASEFPGGKNVLVTIGEEKDLNFEGHISHRIIFNFDGLLLEGLSVSGKVIMHFFKTEKFISTLYLIAILGYYENDVAVLEQMVRSFRVVK